MHEITDKIIAELEAGRVPWVQPWGTAAAKAPLAMPKNAATQRRYSGINVLILWGAVIEHGFAGQSWLTFRQALSLGGHVRKGERGTTVVYADRFTPDDERRRAAETATRRRQSRSSSASRSSTRRNARACPDEMMAAAPPVDDGLILPEAEALIRATGVDFRIGGERAFYDPGMTTCRSHRHRPISSRSTGTGPPCTKLGHASGHPSRLNRDLPGSFGSKKYAFEELVAEMTAAYLCASLGITPTVRHADYIGSWLEVLREDDRAIVRAASAASKAADYHPGVPA